MCHIELRAAPCQDGVVCLHLLVYGAQIWHIRCVASLCSLYVRKPCKRVITWATSPAVKLILLIQGGGAGVKDAEDLPLRVCELVCVCPAGRSWMLNWSTWTAGMTSLLYAVEMELFRREGRRTQNQDLMSQSSFKCDWILCWYLKLWTPLIVVFLQLKNTSLTTSTCSLTSIVTL